MMTRFPYPDFVEFIPKLPKGLKWSDGVRYKSNREWFNGNTWWFLPHGDSMYTKNLFFPACYNDRDDIIFDPAFMAGRKGFYPPTSIAIIHNFHSLTANDVIYPMLDILNIDQINAIDKIWKQHGLPLGFVVPTLKNI